MHTHYYSMQPSNTLSRQQQREEALRHRATRRERIRRRRHRREVRDMLRADKRMQKLKETVREVSIAPFALSESAADGEALREESQKLEDIVPVDLGKEEDDYEDDDDFDDDDFVSPCSGDDRKVDAVRTGSTRDGCMKESLEEESGGSGLYARNTEKSRDSSVEAKRSNNGAVEAGGIGAATEDHSPHHLRLCVSKERLFPSPTEKEVSDEKAASKYKQRRSGGGGDLALVCVGNNRKERLGERKKITTLQVGRRPGETISGIKIRDYVRLQSQNAALRAKVARLTRQAESPPRRPSTKPGGPRSKRRNKHRNTPVQDFRVDREAVAKYVKDKLRADEKYLWMIQRPSTKRIKRRPRLHKASRKTKWPSPVHKSLKSIYCNSSDFTRPTEEAWLKPSPRRRPLRKHKPSEEGVVDLQPESEPQPTVIKDPQTDLVSWAVNDAYDWAESELYQDCHNKLSEPFPDLDNCLRAITYDSTKLSTAFAQASTRLRGLWKELRVPHDLQLRQQALFLDEPTVDNYVRTLNYTARYLTLRTKLLLAFARIQEGRNCVDLLRDVLGPSCKRFIVHGLDHYEADREGG